MNAKDKLRNEKLLLFEKSIGKKFSLKFKPQENKRMVNLIDEVVGVDMAYSHVMGKKYGNFHIDLVSLVDIK